MIRKFRTAKIKPRCRVCGFNWDNHKKYIPNACNNWIPSDNLEYLEYMNEKKSKV